MIPASPSLSTSSQYVRQSMSVVDVDALRDMAVELSPTSSSSSSTTDALKAGYLSKYNRGKWNKKHKWRQRWFVLDHGALTYYKSMPPSAKRGKKKKKLTPPRDTLVLNKTVVLEIPTDLPRNTPTPFCFSITSGSKSLFLCASTKSEFQEWTTAISSSMDPNAAPLVIPTDALQFPRDSLSTFDEPVVSSCYDPWTIFDSPSFAVGVCFVLNPFMVLNLDLIVTSIALIAAFCIWYFWLYRPTSTPYTVIPPVIKPLPEGEPMAEPQTECKPTKAIPHGAVGYVDGKRAYAGCSLDAVAAEASNTAKRAWAPLDATRFRVRKGPNYKRNKTKAPSGPALLELVAVDVFQVRTNYFCLVDDMLVVGFEDRQRWKQSSASERCRWPNRLVHTEHSNTMLHPVKSWGEQKTDGVGINFITYFAIPKAIREQLDQDEDPAHPQIKLLKWFLEEDSHVRDRLKAIVIVANPAEQKLGRLEKHLLETYNGQPLLTRPEHRFYRGDGYFEVDIDGHIFNYLARKGLTGITEHFGNMVVDFGFVMEGHDDDELPENVFGSGSLCKIDVKTASHISFH
ncbi:hypothetical protein Ae201684P_019045 [Aphanomyces euteiches]|nr:hypothetical protein Ae201684P_019045 [Aphanomyces euteiches]